MLLCVRSIQIKTFSREGIDSNHAICGDGTGALGGYFGGRLAAAGHEVCFVARGANLEALKTKGLTVESALGDPLSLYAQFRDHHDERVSMAAQTLLETVPWQ